MLECSAPSLLALLAACGAAAHAAVKGGARQAEAQDGAQETAWDGEADAREFAEAVSALRPRILTGTAQELAVTQEASRVQVVLTRGAGLELAGAAGGWARFE